MARSSYGVSSTRLSLKDGGTPAKSPRLSKPVKGKYVMPVEDTRTDEEKREEARSKAMARRKRAYMARKAEAGTDGPKRRQAEAPRKPAVRRPVEPEVKHSEPIKVSGANAAISTAWEGQ